MRSTPSTPPPADWSAAHTNRTRGARLSGLGALSNLTATVNARDGIRFEWTDTRSRPGSCWSAGLRGSRVAARDSEVNAFGLVTLPNERAYRFADPSAVAHRAMGIS